MIQYVCVYLTINYQYGNGTIWPRTKRPPSDILQLNCQAPCLLICFKFNHSMDMLLHSLYSVGWNYFSLPLSNIHTQQYIEGICVFSQMCIAIYHFMYTLLKIALLILLLLLRVLLQTCEVDLSKTWFHLRGVGRSLVLCQFPLHDSQAGLGRGPCNYVGNTFYDIYGVWEFNVCVM